MKKDTYFIIRIAIAISMFGHGLVRIPKLDAFASGMTKQFENSLLPLTLVKPFAYSLAIAELVIGLLLLLGLFTRATAWAGAITMFFLLFGTCLIENFGALPSQ